METNDLQLESVKLNETVSEINRNIGIYEQRKKIIDTETEELYDQYRSGDTAVYDDLMANLSIQEHINDSLEKNRMAIKSPYFGRIDYYDYEEKKPYSLYIGKHGINKDNINLIIIDWRAPVSTIYYDCNLGRDSYMAVDEYEIPIDLKLKRTLDVRDGKLEGFYDSAAVTDDTLLVKYLSQNKDAVLGDIITTIQKEQNQIIREKPFLHLIVQGVAGSGKTTVAIHRISYLLYNYNDRYQAKEFCILGSNKILLNYITSGLPDLDVHDTKQMRMDEFFCVLLDKQLNRKKYSSIPVLSEGITCTKSTLAFIRALDGYLFKMQKEVIPDEDVKDQYGLYMSREHIQEVMRLMVHLSILEKAETLDERLSKRISLILRDESKDLIRAQKKMYRKYYSRRVQKWDVRDLYIKFLNHWAAELMSDTGIFHETNQKALDTWLDHIYEWKLDIYDLAAMALIRFRTGGIDELYYLKQIFIDEAQDFGVPVYYALKEIMYEARFTIMGDVSQNIHYESGLNEWTQLVDDIFADSGDGNSTCNFYQLSKSYRNTIEISQYAQKILDKTTFQHYPVEPIIRHGQPVQVYSLPNEEQIAKKAIALLTQSLERAYETIAIISADEAQTLSIQKLLAPHIDVEIALQDNFSFQRGIQIIPIDLVKGLEFDVVLLWNASSIFYQTGNRDAKRLYVAVTRALHELYILHHGEIAGLLSE